MFDSKLFLEPKEVVLESFGVKKTFLISKFPYWTARRILTQFPLTATSYDKYNHNEELGQLLFKFIAVQIDKNNWVEFSQPSIVEAHCDAPCGLLLEVEMLKYNGDFLGRGEISDFLNTLIVKAQQLSTKILTGLQGFSLPKKSTRQSSLKKASRLKKPLTRGKR